MRTIQQLDEAIAARPLSAEQLAEVEAIAPRGAIAGALSGGGDARARQRAAVTSHVGDGSGRTAQGIAETSSCLF